MWLINILIIRQIKPILNSYYMGEWGIHKKLHKKLHKFERLLKLTDLCNFFPTFYIRVCKKNYTKVKFFLKFVWSFLRFFKLTFLCNFFYTVFFFKTIIDRDTPGLRDPENGGKKEKWFSLPAGSTERR